VLPGKNDGQDAQVLHKKLQQPQQTIVAAAEAGAHEEETGARDEEMANNGSSIEGPLGNEDKDATGADGKKDKLIGEAR
jgi:hypothetical protein